MRNGQMSRWLLGFMLSLFLSVAGCGRKEAASPEPKEETGHSRGGGDFRTFEEEEDYGRTRTEARTGFDKLVDAARGGLGALSSGGFSGGGGTTPQDAFRSFLEAYRRGDAGALASCFHADTPEKRQLARAIAETFAATRRLEVACGRKFGRKAWREAALRGLGMAPFADVDDLDMSKVTFRGSEDMVVAVIDGSGSLPFARMNGVWKIPMGSVPAGPEFAETLRRMSSVAEALRRAERRLGEATTPEDFRDILIAEVQKSAL